MLKPWEQKFIKIEVSIINELSGLFIVKMLDKTALDYIN